MTGSGSKPKMNKKKQAEMNALTQYIDLYRSNREMVDAASAPVINRLRPDALAFLENVVLPRKGQENYETIDLEKLLAPDFGINLSRIDIDVNSLAPFHCGVPNLTPAIFFLQNDIYKEARDARGNFPDGLYVGSLRNFCLERPEIAEKYYGRIADISNPLVALNSLLVQDGIVIWAKKGVKTDFPIQIVSILENGAPLMALRRILIIAEEETRLKVLMCDHTQNDQTNFLNLQTVEIYAGENSDVEVCEMEESSEHTTRLSCAYTEQGKGSRLSAVGITLYNGVTRNELHSRFSGQDASLQLAGMAIEDRSRMIDTFSEVVHTLPGCHTDEIFKYVVDDSATATFNGMIKVEKGASKTEAYQNNRNIIGNEGARVYSKPRLEIYDDDVKCSHGSAIGRLDQKQIFYMRTRGLSEEQAVFLLKQAFMSDVIEKISLPDFRRRLHTLVERRFAGADRNCSSCRNCLGDD